jgi:hypothetical protein
MDWNVVTAVSTALLVIIGAFTAWAALQTLHQVAFQASEMKRQADALDRQMQLLETQLKEAKDSSASFLDVAISAAQAALVSARETSKTVEFLVNSERAWVILELTQEALNIGSRWDFVIMKMINNGRTAARIKAFQYKVDAMRLQALTGQPLTPEVTPSSEQFDILTPGEERHLYVAFKTLGDDVYLSIAQGHTQLYCHGFVLYEDAGGRERTNRFCLQYTHEGQKLDGTTYFWRPAGPAKFIDHN